MGGLGTRELKQGKMICRYCGEAKGFVNCGVCVDCAKDLDPKIYRSDGAVRCPGLARRV